MPTKKKRNEDLGPHTLMFQAQTQVRSFSAQIDLFEKKFLVLGRSKSTFKNYDYNLYPKGPKETPNYRRHLHKRAKG